MEQVYFIVNKKKVSQLNLERFVNTPRQPCAAQIKTQAELVSAQ